MGRMTIRYAVAHVRRNDRFAAPEFAGRYVIETRHSACLTPDGWWGARPGWRATVRTGAYSAR